jgi:hypothetical protein
LTIFFSNFSNYLVHVFNILQTWPTKCENKTPRLCALPKKITTVVSWILSLLIASSSLSTLQPLKPAQLTASDEKSKTPVSHLHRWQILAVMVGGLLTSYVTWRWYFYIDLIVSGSALAVLAIFVDLSRSSHDANQPALGLTEWLRSALTTTAVTGFPVGFQLKGVSLSWGSATVVGLVFAGCTIAASFVV